ncbi:uncharacterized protein AKAW2_20043S [Aspergillus luchuensis]|uniref:Uncharacterized protein n=2 Tax=Aspergillus kawachii TaxID=1069201 RepID=A0A7R7ZUG8_ASPKA|nr:uncharacterized protein AKAW2_20043S [Aspergillus luchuensis]BCR95103.1 hypothetical protein AKAW2_20043S [Aspergillus luchuensis]BCS07670.1 hypothetical protein ALUC_20040S [Aspergillus luchuensis]
MVPGRCRTRREPTRCSVTSSPPTLNDDPSPRRCMARRFRAAGHIIKDSHFPLLEIPSLQPNHSEINTQKSFSLSYLNSKMKLTGAVLASLVGCVAALPPAPFFNGPPPPPSGSVAPAPEESSFPPPPPPSSVSGAPPSATPEPYEKRQFGGPFGGPQPSGPPAGPSGSFGPAPSGSPEGFGRRQFGGFGGFGGPFDSAPSATPSAFPGGGFGFEQRQFPGPAESTPAGPPPSGTPSPVPFGDFGDFGGFDKRQFGGPIQSAPAGAPSGAPGPAPSEGPGGFGGFGGFKRQFGSPAEGHEQGPHDQAPPFPSGVPSFAPSPVPTPSGAIEERQFGAFPTPTPVPSGPAGGW